MMKPILLVSAFALAAPALAQTTTPSEHQGHHAGQQGTAATTGVAVQADTDTPATTSSTTEGTGANAAVAAASNEDAAGQSGATTHPGQTSSGGAGPMTGQTSTAGAMGTTSAINPGTAGVAPTTGSVTASTGPGPSTAGAPMTGATMAQGQSGNGFSGMGGPNGDLLDVAGEMIGDTSRVNTIMSGRDTGMKASDLLNQAMLTLMQSASNTPR